MCKGYRWLLSLSLELGRYFETLGEFETLAECRKAARSFLANAPEGRSCEACTVFGVPQKAIYPGTKTHVFEREAGRVVEWSYDACAPWY